MIINFVNYIIINYISTIVIFPSELFLDLWLGISLAKNPETEIQTEIFESKSDPKCKNI